MTLLLATTIVTAAALLLRGITLTTDRRVLARLGEDFGTGQVPSSSMAAWLGRRCVPDPVRRRAAERSRLRERDLDKLLGRKFGLGCAGLLVGSLTGTGFLDRLALGGVLGAGGFTLPSFYIARRAAARAGALRRSIPDALDVVAVGVSAGLTARLALERASDAASEPLASELDRVRRDVALGVPWLRALSGAAERTGLDELKRLTATLARSERLGSPVGERLRALARDVRDEHRAEGEERARRAPVAMLFPLVFLILPAFVLTAIVPAVLVATRGIR